MSSIFNLFHLRLSVQVIWMAFVAALFWMAVAWYVPFFQPRPGMDYRRVVLDVFVLWFLPPFLNSVGRDYLGVPAAFCRVMNLSILITVAFYIFYSGVPVRPVP